MSFRLLLAILLAGCGTTVNMAVPQPNLQTINLGQPNCAMDCHTTHTATQSIGDGDVQGATVTNTSTRSRTPMGAPAQ
jgi:hypothetical protein